MTYPHDHHPTERLRPFLTGELSEHEAVLVEAHLATCPECRSEQRALEILLSDAPAMDDVERARLRRDVAAAVGSAAPAPSKRASRLAPRIAPALGAAATILLFAAGAVWVGTNLGARDEAMVEDAAPEAPELADEPPGRAFDADAEEVTPRAGELAAESGAARVGTVTKDGPEPVFRADVGDFGPVALRRFGSRGGPFRRFVSAYQTTAAATSAGQRMLVESLAEQAEDPSIRPQIRACAETVLSDLPGPVLPAYGATGSFQDRPALVLGFVHAAEPGPLDRFMLWVWPRGECAAILHYEAGRIDR